MRHHGEHQEPSALREAGERARVLLADDDDAMRALLARALNRANFEVTEARSGSELFEWLAADLDKTPSRRFDLMISDVRMPGYDGLNVLASLRQLAIETPVILITAFGTAATHAAAAHLGAFALLDKPFDVDDLMTLARSATSQASPNQGR
jgi:two-component system response regulator (stage 0 sporulation protein F)